MSSLQSLDYSHEGVTLHGQLALPEATGPRPAVLVMHDGLGQSRHDCERAQRLADAGYVALATDMYGFGMRGAPREEYGPIFRAFQDDPQRLRARVLAGFEALRGLAQVDSSRMAAIGFCFGGQCVLELARTGADVKAVVSFHGLLGTQIPTPRGGVKAMVLAITGALDPFVPESDVQRFQEEMAAAEADWHLTIYGQGWHAFTDPDVSTHHDIPGVRYDPALDHLSWSQATAFLATALHGE